VRANGGNGGAEAVDRSRDEQVGADGLAALVAKLRGAERLLAEAVILAGRLAGSGVSERVEGVALEQLLGLACGMTGADRRMLVSAGEVLADMPASARRDRAPPWPSHLLRGVQPPARRRVAHPPRRARQDQRTVARRP
jgi:hypothetical protein